MAEKIVIIGCVALGSKAACRCKRLAPDAEVTVVDENLYISYGGCGMPYFVSGDVQNLDALRSTNADIIRDPQFFWDQKGVKVFNQTRALKIDREKKTVLVEDLTNGQKRELPYDKLVIATGARARIPRIEGVSLHGIMALTKLSEAEKLRKECESLKIKSAVVLGGGFIGLETAVALADQWGIEVHVVEMMDQIMPGVLPPTIAKMAQHDLESNNVKVYTSEKITRFEGMDGRVNRVITDKREISAQLVILAAGFIPNSELAKDAGLEVAPFGGIITDEYLRTSDPVIYTGGDCAAIKNIITGKPGYIPLGSQANRQGRVVGSNLAGLKETFPGYVGAWAVKLFKFAFCGAGLTAKQARDAGFDAIGVYIEQLDRAHFYPEKEMLGVELVVDKTTRRVLGIQGVGKDNASVKARVDAVAAVLEYAKPNIEDISNLEVAYAPPFAAAMDIVNTVANVADNVVSGRFKPIDGDAFMDLWHDRAHNNVYFIDTRPAKASKKVEAQFPDWHAIPLVDLPERMKDIPKDRPVALVCNTGHQAYCALLYLKEHGYTDLEESMGGMQAITRMGLKP